MRAAISLGCNKTDTGGKSHTLHLNFIHTSTFIRPQQLHDATVTQGRRTCTPSERLSLPAPIHQDQDTKSCKSFATLAAMPRRREHSHALRQSRAEKGRRMHGAVPLPKPDAPARSLTKTGLNRGGNTRCKTANEPRECARRACIWPQQA